MKIGHVQMIFFPELCEELLVHVGLKIEVQISFLTLDTTVSHLKVHSVAILHVYVIMCRFKTPNEIRLSF